MDDDSTNDDDSTHDDSTNDDDTNDEEKGRGQGRYKRRRYIDDSIHGGEGVCLIIH